MTPHAKDFDLMFAELEERRIPFTILGETHSISCEIPAMLVLELARSDSADGVDGRLILKAARRIFGEALVDRLCAQPDFTLRKLEMMLSWALEVVSGSAAPEPERKN